MRRILLILIAVIMSGPDFTGLQAQTMYVREKAGTQALYNLNYIQKMSFSSGNMIVQTQGSSSGSYVVGDLRYIIFSDITTTALTPNKKEEPQGMSLYPNPVSGSLLIKPSNGKSLNGILNILTVEGRVVKSQKISLSNEAIFDIDIGELARGIYFCRYTDEKETYTSKFIKQ
jgi:hypothetical protein